MLPRTPTLTTLDRGAEPWTANTAGALSRPVSARTFRDDTEQPRPECAAPPQGPAPPAPPAPRAPRAGHSATGHRQARHVPTRPTIGHDRGPQGHP